MSALRLFRLVLIALGLSAIVACGQTGPLVLPDDPETAEDEEDEQSDDENGGL